MSLPLIVVSFGLNGICCKRSCLRGIYERYPMLTIKFIFFHAIILGRQAAKLHMDAMFGLADNSDWLLENYPALRDSIRARHDAVWREAKEATKREVDYLRENSKRADERAGKAEAENYALRKVIKICSE